MYKTILVATDGSDHADRALDAAAGLAKTLGASLHLVHVPQIETPPLVFGATVAMIDAIPTAQQIAEAGEAVVAEAASRLARAGLVPAGVTCRPGDAARQTLKVAEDVGADLIVLGRRGVGAVQALVLGSVSQEVARRADCAVLTVT